MSDPLSRAIADLQKKEEEIKRLQGEADKLRVFIELYQSYSRPDAPHVHENGAARSKKDAVTDAAANIIKRHHSPVQLGTIFDELESAGIEVGSSDPRQYLSQILNRDDRFKSIRGVGWTLVEFEN